MIFTTTALTIAGTYMCFRHIGIIGGEVADWTNDTIGASSIVLMSAVAALASWECATLAVQLVTQ